MIWNKEAECMSEEQKEKLQLKRLQKVVKKAYKNVPYYKKRFDDNNIKPEDIKTLKDIEKLPFTSKSDLREAYPFGMFAVPDEDIVEVHTSSGTTGKPTVSGYTLKDLEIWGEVMARCFSNGWMPGKKGFYSKCLWIWSFYRRNGSTLRCTENWCNSSTNFSWKHQRQLELMQGFWNNYFNVYTILCALFG